MPLMKTDDGKLFTSIETINKYLAPNTLSSFEISDEINQSAKLGAEPEKLWELFPQDLDHEYRKMGYDNRLLFHIVPEVFKKERERFKKLSEPHINQVNEIHHVLFGNVIFGFAHAQGQQVLLLFPGEKISIFSGCEHWSHFTDDYRVTLATYRTAPQFPIQMTETKIRVSI